MFATIRNRLNGRLSVLALAIALVTTGAASLAQLTDTLTVSNSFSVLAIDLQGNGQQSITASFALEAGQVNGPVQTITLSNNGNTQIRYAMRTAVTGTLAPNLKTDVSTSTDTNCGDANDVRLITPVVNNPQFGDPITGQQVGDRILAAGASETLCFMHSAAAASNGSQTASQVITFSAETTN